MRQTSNLPAEAKCARRIVSLLVLPSFAGTCAGWRELCTRDYAEAPATASAGGGIASGSSATA